MVLLDLLWLLAIILLIGWLLGLFVFALGPIVHVLLVLILIVILIRLLTGRRVL